MFKFLAVDKGFYSVFANKTNYFGDYDDITVIGKYTSNMP
jgi:hypothetical protein